MFLLTEKYSHWGVSLIQPALSGPKLLNSFCASKSLNWHTSQSLQSWYPYCFHQVLASLISYPKKNLLSSVRTMRPFILYIRITSLSQSQCQQWHTVDTSTVPSGNSRRVSHWGSMFSEQSRQPTITNCGTNTWNSGLSIKWANLSASWSTHNPFANNSLKPFFFAPCGESFLALVGEEVGNHMPLDEVGNFNGELSFHFSCHWSPDNQR